ncbi:MAG: PD40 domain-containing protein [Phocaeicola sp.]|nr:PD40 domain-containing protein [Phocaeicola sp.]
MKKLGLILCVMLGMMFQACTTEIKVSKMLDEEVEIFPDYKDVTIPVNIAPLNFMALNMEDKETGLVIEGERQKINVQGPNFMIPQKAWRKLLEEEQGKSIRLTVCKKVNGEWIGMKPFAMSVVSDKVDKYIAYRLIAPGYGLWNKMGIYQRCLESYDQSPIYENKLTDYNCVNCHSFPMRSPEKMVFHMRSKHGGTVYLDGENVEKLNTKTDQTISALVYPYWHPSGDYIAFSTNNTLQAFFANHVNRIEVFDTESDVVVYNTRTKQVMGSPLTMSKAAYETFPTFSPDGRSLYFCSTDSISPMPKRYKETHYSLCRIDFNPENGTFGEKVDTIYNAKSNEKSVSFPRISPDGKYLAFTLHQFGNFSIWHKDADLYMVNLDNQKIYPLTEANSENVESYHSWSDNNRWLVYSSRRLDGLYTRPFFTYIDANGQAHKPFLLPQKNPMKYYKSLMFSYNIPEFVKDKVKFNRHAISKEMRESKGTDLTFRK